MSAPKGDTNRSARRYMKYSGIGFNLAALLLLAVYGGQYLDEKYKLDKPWFTIILMLIALGAWFTKLLRDLNDDSKKDNHE